MFVAKQWAEKATNISEWMALPGTKLRATGKQLMRQLDFVIPETVPPSSLERTLQNCEYLLQVHI